MPRVKVIKSAARVIGGPIYGLITHGWKGFVKGLEYDAIIAASLATGGVAAALLTTASLIASDYQAHSRPKGSATGSPTDFKADPQAPIPYMVGRSYQAGYIIHRDTFGTKGAYQGLVGVWTLGPIHEIESIQVDNAATTFSSGAATGAYAGWMWLATQLGACPEASALASSQGTLPGWDSTSKLSGLAAFLWTLKFDPKGEKYAGGVPQMGAVIKAVLVYDPRIDSTYPGGSGACRALNEATYVWSENPWLHALTFAMGRFQNGKRVAGVGMPVASIDVAAFVEAANIADANGWKVGGTVSSADDKWNVLKMMAQAGGGECMRLGARLSCLVQTPRVSLATITGADLVGRASVTATQRRRDRINGVVARIRSEAHGWEVVPLDVVRGSTYLTEDGAERTREIDYQLVQDADQGAQLAAYDVAAAREFGPVSLPLKPVWLGYKPGDCLTCDIPELGLNSQPCIQTNRDLEPASGLVTMTLRSETAAKHAWALGQTGTAPPTPSLGAPDFATINANYEVLTETQSLIATSFPLAVTVSATDAGASCTASIGAHTRRYNDKDVAVNSGTVTGLGYEEDYYIYYDDPSRAGGAVTYHAALTPEDAGPSDINLGRHFVAQVTTPAAGAADTDGATGGTPWWKSGDTIPVIDGGGAAP